MHHDNDNKPTRNYGASPHTGRPLQAIRKLAKEDWRAALAIYLEIQQAPATPLHSDDVAENTHSDDIQAWEAPAAEMTFAMLAETPYSAAKNDGARQETTTSERPTVRDLFKNIGWIEWPWCGRPSARRGKRKAMAANGNSRPASIGWAMRLDSGKVVGADGDLMPPPVADDYRRYVGGLTYSALNGMRKGAAGGMLVSYIGSNGKDWSPKEDRSEKGPARHRSRSAIEAYLNLPAAIASPLAAESYQRPIEPTGWFDVGGTLAEKQEARTELESMMADYRGPVTKCPPAVARSAWCMGGVVGNKETKSTPAPIWEAPAKRGLSPLLEAVAAGANLMELGHVAGGVTSAQRASRTGKAALLAEAARLIEAAAARGEPLPDEPNDAARKALAKLSERDAKSAAWQAKKAARKAANDNDQAERQAA